jgi:hypothetical protein
MAQHHAPNSMRPCGRDENSASPQEWPRSSFEKRSDFIAPADAFDIFSVMLTENPAILNKKLFLHVTACADSIALQRDNPGIIGE